MEMITPAKITAGAQTLCTGSADHCDMHRDPKIVDVLHLMHTLLDPDGVCMIGRLEARQVLEAAEAVSA